MTPLRRKYTEFLVLRGYADRTQQSYIEAVAGLAQYYGRGPQTLSDDEIRRYLLGLCERGLSFSTTNIAASALRLLYGSVLGRPMENLQDVLPRRNKPARRARVYAREELQELFSTGCRQIGHRAFLMTVYGSGLRLNEACRLKVWHVESGRMMLRVDQGKGRKDRYTILGASQLQTLREYYAEERPKEWLFPACRRGDGPMIPGTAQKIFYNALERAGLPNRGGIHCLRHSLLRCAPVASRPHLRLALYQDCPAAAGRVLQPICWKAAWTS